MARPQGRLCCRRGDMGRAEAGAGHYSVGFPLPFVGKMKSPAGNRILARGGRAVNLKGPGCRKSCSRSDAVTALKLSSRWDFFMCCFFSHFFFFFFFAVGLFGSINCHLVSFVREEEFPAFPGVLGIDPPCSLPLGSWGPSPSQALPSSLPTFCADPRVAPCSISH